MRTVTRQTPIEIERQAQEGERNRRRLARYYDRRIREERRKGGCFRGVNRLHWYIVADLNRYGGGA